MPQRHYGPIAVPFLVLVGLCVFLTGIRWGLPSRRVDPYLFGDHPVWSGAEILALAGDRQGADVGADVDRNPSKPGDLLSVTNAQRAQIVRRYRLFTEQPDEMITMMALGGMKPSEGDFDPKLYQYGGLWIYPVGALIKLTAPLRSQAYYLDHPDEFGWFYVVARLYTVTWGLLGVWAVHQIAERGGAGPIGSVGAALLYVFLPVVVNQAHEAKPHLPGAVLILLTVMAAGKFVETGRARWWVFAGALCGAAAGMILSAAVVFVVIPLMVLMRGGIRPVRIGIAAGAVGIGVGVYFLLNPYVLIHLVGDAAVLKSNLGNSASMYPAGTRLGQGLVNAMRLLAHGTTPIATVTGFLGAIVLLRVRRSGNVAMRLLLAVAAVVLVQFIVLAAGKPGEYARFALVPSIALVLATAIWIGRAGLRTFEQVEVIALVLVLTILPSAICLRGYSRDAGASPRRLEYARDLAALQATGARTLGVWNEPAPYLLPPVDVFEWIITLVPREFDLDGGEAPFDVIVRPVDQLQAGPRERGAYVRISERIFDDLFPARISWAAKPFEIWVRRTLIRPATRPANE